MAEFIVVTWSVIQGCMERHEECITKLLDYWKQNSTRFKLKSLRYYRQAIGGEPFSYGRVMIYEYDSLADWEYFEKEMEKDKTAIGLKDKLFVNIDLKTRRVVEWQDGYREHWLE